MYKKKPTNKQDQLTIVITRSYESLDLIKDCLTSIQFQNDCKATVLFLDQQLSNETKSYVATLESKNIKFKYINIPEISNSFARNYGLNKAKTNYVAFCDVDCILEKNYISEIINTFQKENATIVGTKVTPLWGGPIKWFHKSKFIQEFYSLLDLSNVRCDVPKIMGGSYAVDKYKLGKEGYFDEKLGRSKTNSLGGEETDLCQRVRKNGGKIIYTPHTNTRHQISKNRINTLWLLKTVYNAGSSRVVRGGKTEPFNKKYTFLDKLALTYILPFYVLGYLKSKIKIGKLFIIS